MTGGRGAGLALLALAGVLFMVAVVSGWSAASGLQGREGTARAVEQAATDFVAAHGTFDYRDPHVYAQRLVPLTSGLLHTALAAAAVDPAALGAERSVTTRIERVSVTALSDDAATAVVTAVQVRRWVDRAAASSDHQQLQETVRQRMTCRLVREDGRWLVAAVHLESVEQVGATGR
ncbi:MAG: hypothetical protein M0R75_10480 [Dehalococcoidia bacterium]|nr:hypothetical protein [Dehalococcoidia bacterium]